MMAAADGRIAVKGSGCIRTREHFLELIDMDIDRMGIGCRPTPTVLGLMWGADLLTRVRHPLATRCARLTQS